MKKGLELVTSLSYHQAIAESDCLEVIEACKGGQTWWNEEVVVYVNCINLVTEIGIVQYSHCLREANDVAHGIAKHSYENHLSL